MPAISRIPPLNDARLALPKDHAFRYLTNCLVELPEGTVQPLEIRTAAEIEAERFARKG